ncbi:MAG: helix-turn-helix domain-containing protein [Alloprevotella sp.]|nr:helix-turn-helix domain-containing protein [Alloprevotella sp.]
MYKHLTREQRYAIYLGLQKHETNKAIAQAIKVSESGSCEVRILTKCWRLL